MRIFLIAIIIILSFISFTKGDDIKDFEIEEISIGDSLLNFFNETEIKPKQYPKSDKFSRASVFINSESYDLLQFHFKTNDKNYEIFGISGNLLYEKNINDCYSKLSIISDEISKIFINIEKNAYSKKHAMDSTGKSTNKGYTYFFPDNSYINIACYDWSKEIEEKSNFVDNLRVTIIEKELGNWLRNEAY
tara:strand:- start:256 stop:828 length:573 start_codon:yes stop_codon:yes gene_type:complete